jgi:hypothetical protein
LEAARLKGPALALACLLLSLAAAPDRSLAAAPAQPPRVAIAFLPGPAPKVKPPMIERLAAVPGLKIGFMSAIMGSYVPEQTLLDISSGSRTWTSLYDGALEVPMRLARRDGSGAVSGWSVASKRARTPPADVVPGTLASSVAAAGGSVAYAGIRGRANREAIVAADRDGRVERVSIATRRAVGRAASRAWRGTRLLVARLPSGRDGRRALALLLRERRPADLVVAVQDPTGLPRRLLAIGAAGLAGGRDLRSESTRTDGIVVSTDIAPTVLGRLGVAVPHAVSGEPIEARGSRSAADLTSLRDRLAEVGPRRWSVVLLGFIGAVAIAAAAAALARDLLRLTARAAFLAALWLPSVLLVTGALAPSRWAEALAIAIGAGALALTTAALLPWPRALVPPATVTVVAQLADLAFGSPLTQRSLLGPNPILGARFYGVGNELEVTLAVVALVGLGAAFATASARTQRRAFVIGGGALAVALSWGRLGADVGASVMLAAGIAAAAVAVRDGLTRGHPALIVLAAPLAGLAALALLDLATGGNAHFTRSVLRAGGLGDLADIAQRRVELSYRSLGRGVIGLLALLAVAALVWGVRSRRRLLSPLESHPGLAAGFAGAVVAVVVGALSNDSGPIILLIGTSYLALGVGYFQAAAK